MTNNTNQPNIPSYPQNIRELVSKAKEIYESKKSEFESTNIGKYIAIDPNSSDYFIGDTRDEASKKARQTHPGVIVFTRKIGELEKVARHYHSPNSLKSYARIL